jgi:hypothetical protein
VGGLEQLPADQRLVGCLRLTDHHGVEPTVRVAERLEKSRSFGAPFPRQGSGLTDVEELGDHLAV